MASMNLFIWAVWSADHWGSWPELCRASSSPRADAHDLEGGVGEGRTVRLEVASEALQLVGVDQDLVHGSCLRGRGSKGGWGAYFLDWASRMLLAPVRRPAAVTQGSAGLAGGVLEVRHVVDERRGRLAGPLEALAA